MDDASPKKAVGGLLGRVKRAKSLAKSRKVGSKHGAQYEGLLTELYEHPTAAITAQQVFRFHRVMLHDTTAVLRLH